MALRSNELMIGDWVYVAHLGRASHFGKVTALLPTGAVETDIDGSLALSSSVEPIPITPEILEKNGFRLSIAGKSRKPYQYVLRDLYISWWKGRLNMRFCPVVGRPMQVLQINCAAVHELQHALRVAGWKKEIVV